MLRLTGRMIGSCRWPLIGHETFRDRTGAPGSPDLPRHAVGRTWAEQGGESKRSLFISITQPKGMLSVINRRVPQVSLLRPGIPATNPQLETPTLRFGCHSIQGS